MTIQYNIFEIGESGLAPIDNFFNGKQQKIVLVEPQITQTHNSFEEALKCIEERGDYYKEYTIIPRIYKTK